DRPLAELLLEASPHDDAQEDAVEHDEQDESVDDEVRSHGPGLVEHADEEHDQRDRDEHLADREARVDVVADVAALGARVAGTHEALIAIHDAEAGLIAPPAHLVAGAPRSEE